MASVAQKLRAALQQHQSGDLERAERLYRQIVRLDPRHADALHLLGVAAHQRGQNQQAVELIQRAIAIHGTTATYHSNLGAAYRAQGKLDEAVGCFQQAVRIDPHSGDAYCNLGRALTAQLQHDAAILAFEQAVRVQPQHLGVHNDLGTAYMQLGQTDAAVASYRRAVATAPDNVNAHTNLGHALREKGERDEALASFRRALMIDPGKHKAHSTVGKILHSKGELEEAIVSYRQSLQLSPSDAGIHYLLGNALKEQEQLDDAIASYQWALNLRPQFTEAQFELGNAHKRRGELDRARDCYEAVLKIAPGDVATLIVLGNVLKTQNHLTEAADCYRAALKSSPQKAVWDLWIATLCPSVFHSTDEIQAYREKLLDELHQVSHSKFKLSTTDVNSYACPPPYELPFHGMQDRPLKEAYANVFRESFTPVEPLPPLGQPRVGFVVTDGHEGAFLRCMKGVVERIDHERFDVEIVCSSTGTTRIRQQLNDESIRILAMPSRFELALECVREARFDVLYYWEVGSDVVNYFLPFFRPAPVQCTGWGVPVTTGIAEMDYFLSSRLVEPAAAEHDYTEQLLLANTLLTWQKRLCLPDQPRDRSTFGFEKRQHVYLCTQHIRKIHPDFDFLIAEILRRDRRGVVAIVEDQNRYAAKKLLGRLSARVGDVVDRIIFLPYQTMANYFSLVAAADVVLDTLHFGGGLTAYDAFSFNKPLVTLPSRFRRSRYASACYQMMDISDCVAATTDEYVDIAVAIGSDSDYQADLSTRIGNASERLFENDAAVREFENLFQSLIEQSRSF